jgi:hypothetical protein
MVELHDVGDRIVYEYVYRFAEYVYGVIAAEQPLKKPTHPSTGSG